MRFQGKFILCVGAVLTGIIAAGGWLLDGFCRDEFPPPLTAHLVLWATVLSLAALAAVGLCARIMLVRPIQRIGAEMQRIAEDGAYDRDLGETSRRDELGQCTRAFNRVLNTVRNTIESLRDATTQRRSEEQLLRLSQVFLGLGKDIDKNIHLITEACSHLLSATCVVYCRLGDGRLYATNHWQAPPSFHHGDASKGHLCHDLVRQGWLDAPMVLRNLQQTSYLKSDPNVAVYGLSAYAGQVVCTGGRACGTLSVVYKDDVEFGTVEQHILGILAGAIATEEERKRGEWIENDRRQVLEMVALNEPLHDILERITSIIERQHPALGASVLLLRDGRMSHGAVLNIPEEFRLMIDERAIQLAGAMRLASLDRDDPLVMCDLASDPAWEPFREVTHKHGLTACCSVPIQAAGGDSVGMLMLFCRQQERLDQSELDLLRMLSRLAAIAVEQRQLSDQMLFRAQHDPLTGLPNRVLFEDRLAQAIIRARRYDQSVGLFFIDLDRFKVINDTLGHHAGDQLLHQVAERFKGCIRASDTLVRLGGDEFALVLPEMKDRNGAMRAAKALIQSLKTPFNVEGHDFYVSASIGISIFPHDAQDAADLQRNADTAMYRVKTSGKNGYECFAPEMNEIAMEKLSLENELRRAIDNNELELYYQPLVDPDGNLYSLESLIRWIHPKRGIISPIKFIPLAEETGLIIPIGEWVLRQACRQSRIWQDAGLPPVRIAVNVSTLQFAQTNFVDSVINAYQAANIEPELLQIEITESLLMGSTQNAAEKLNLLRARGVSVGIDDFGTGYSSLAYLQSLPVDALKIDRSFIREIQGDHPALISDSRTAVIRAITSLAHNMGMRVVAEGVETREQAAFLRLIGCDALQGYLFSPPISARDIEPIVGKRRVEPRASVPLAIPA